MKKYILIPIVLLSLVFVGCDNQAKQQELEKQKIEDSIRVAENTKKELAEKEAKERAEREKQEAKERAARKAAEQAERESKTWTGASSVSELRSKLIGTSWETTNNVFKYKVTFSNGHVNMCVTDLNGDGFKEEETYKYEIRDKDGHFFVLMGNSTPIDFTSDLEYSVVFKGNNATLYSNQAVRMGVLTFLGR